MQARFIIVLVSAVSMLLASPTVTAEHRWTLHGTEIRLSTGGGELSEPGAAVEWVNAGVADIAAYLGRFPVERLAVHMDVRAGVGGIGGGRQHAGSPPRLTLNVGALTEAAQFRSDWVLTHEMAHLAFPPLDRRHRWAEEGLATYVESIARLRRGRLDAGTVWGGFLRQMPAGLEAASKTGLDGRRDWASVYWGGAAFFLIADVRLRAQSGGRYGLEHALAALNRAGGHQGAPGRWRLDEAFAAADKALDVQILGPLYASMGTRAFDYSMHGLFTRLGIGPAGLDKGGTIAAIRQTIEIGNKL